MAEIRHSKHAEAINPDPITGEPGSHPVGTGAGAIGGGLTGVAIGTTVAGPVGGAVGAVIGALAGAYVGKGIAEAVDPTAEDAYWRVQHPKQTFAREDHAYDKLIGERADSSTTAAGTSNGTVPRLGTTPGATGTTDHL